MNGAECTSPPRDWAPVDLTGGDVDQIALGFMPRAIRANTSGTFIGRFVDTATGAPDRVLHVQAGEVLSGFVTIIRASSDASLHVAK